MEEADDGEEEIVGEDENEGGGVTGDDEADELVELSEVSETRDTTKRFRDGLGIGLATGEGIGEGAGERKRPPVVRFAVCIVDVDGNDDDVRVVPAAITSLVVPVKGGERAGSV